MNRLHETIRTLHSFAGLEKGWHFGEGGPIDDEVLRAATEVIAAGHDQGFTDIDVFPGLSNNVQVVFCAREQCVEVDIEEDCSIAITREHPEREDEEISCTGLNDLKTFLERIRQEIWRDLSGSYSPGISIQVKSDLLVPVFRIHLAEAFQLLMKIAQNESPGQCVNILKSSTQDMESESTIGYSIRTFQSRHKQPLEEMETRVIGTSPIFPGHRPNGSISNQRRSAPLLV